MLFRKKHFIVAITTNNPDMLRISVPRLRNIGHKFILVLHNRNVEKTLKKSAIRKLGWHGQLKIINSIESTDEITSKIALIDFVEKYYPYTKFITFVGDGDVLLSQNMPDIPESVFAVVQNAVTISNNVSEFLKINKKWVHSADCGVTGPHFDINGTWLRFNILCKFRDFLIPLLPQALKIAKKLHYDFLMSSILWQGINTFVHETEPGFSALYMNQTNYVAVRLGQDRDNAAALAADSNIISQFNELFRYGIAQNVVASGQ